jgi:hypothetical protein
LDKNKDSVRRRKLSRRKRREETEKTKRWEEEKV